MDHTLDDGLELLPTRRSEPTQRLFLGLRASLGLHVAALGLVALVPTFTPPTLPATRDDFIRLAFGPPPPPPARLPKGSPFRAQQARPEVTRTVGENQRMLTPPIETPLPDEREPPQPDSGTRADDQFGSESGSDLGNALGIEDGVDGGVPGGTPGGVPGGDLAASGVGPVSDYDSPPRAIRLTKPVYPHEAFIQKVEGEVLLEILIAPSGRVVRARVLRSVPLLDAAALACVQDWTFLPALRRGRPAPMAARAPVRFQLF